MQHELYEYPASTPEMADFADILARCDAEMSIDGEGDYYPLNFDSPYSEPYMDEPTDRLVRLHGDDDEFDEDEEYDDDPDFDDDEEDEEDFDGDGVDDPKADGEDGYYNE